MGSVLFRGWRAGAVAAAVGVMLVVGAVPAQATIFEGGHYSGTDSFTYDDCGIPVAVQTEFSGVYHIREGKNADDSAFFLSDNYSYRDVHTNVDNGKWFVVSGNGLFHETRATRIEGNIFEFDSIESGQPFVVQDSSGNIVVRDRGVVRRTIRFDTGGDDVPGGEFVEFISLEVGGPHPGLFEDFCAMVNNLIG